MPRLLGPSFTTPAMKSACKDMFLLLMQLGADQLVRTMVT